MQLYKVKKVSGIILVAALFATSCKKSDDSNNSQTAGGNPVGSWTLQTLRETVVDNTNQQTTEDTVLNYAANNHVEKYTFYPDSTYAYSSNVYSSDTGRYMTRHDTLIFSPVSPWLPSPVDTVKYSVNGNTLITVFTKLESNRYLYTDTRTWTK